MSEALPAKCLSFIDTWPKFVRFRSEIGESWPIIAKNVIGTSPFSEPLKRNQFEFSEAKSVFAKKSDCVRGWKEREGLGNRNFHEIGIPIASLQIL